MKKPKWLALSLLLLFINSGRIWASEYFLYDLEKNKILVMNDAEYAFTERMDLEKKPDMMMQTSSPGKYLAIFAPRYEQDKHGKIIKYYQPGQLAAVDLGTGRTEDLVELGYLPMVHTYTPDHRHFFISYRPKPDGPPELLHYDISGMKNEKFDQIAQPVKILTVSNDRKQLYLVTAPDEKNNTFQLLTLGFSPLAIKSSLTLENNPVNLFVLGDDRVVLVAAASGSKQVMGGSVKLIDTQANTVIEERNFKFLKSRLEWFDKEKTLILIADDNNISRCYKINSNGFRYYEIPRDWIDFDYLPQKDLLYILTGKNLKLIDYRNSATRIIETGPNDGPEKYYFRHLPDSGLAIIYCFEKGNIKFFDINTNKILKKVNCGRPGVKFLNALLFSSKETETVITTNRTASRFFILNRATNDITVLNDKFKRLGFIVPPEPPLGMYQIEKPELQTMVVTGKKVYQIDDQNLELKPVYQFTAPSEPKLFIVEEKRILLVTNLEILVLDPVTLAPQNAFLLYTASDAKFTKLKPGVQRYYFIQPL